MRVTGRRCTVKFDLLAVAVLFGALLALGGALAFAVNP